MLLYLGRGARWAGARPRRSGRPAGPGAGRGTGRAQLLAGWCGRSGPGAFALAGGRPSCTARGRSGPANKVQSRWPGSWPVAQPADQVGYRLRPTRVLRASCSRACTSGHSANRLFSPCAISGTDMIRARAAASSTASDSPSRCRHSSSTVPGCSPTPDARPPHQRRQRRALMGARLPCSVCEGTRPAVLLRRSAGTSWQRARAP